MRELETPVVGSDEGISNRGIAYPTVIPQYL